MQDLAFVITAGLRPCRKHTHKHKHIIVFSHKWTRHLLIANWTAELAEEKEGFSSRMPEMIGSLISMMEKGSKKFILESIGIKKKNPLVFFFNREDELFRSERRHEGCTVEVQTITSVSASINLLRPEEEKLQRRQRSRKMLKRLIFLTLGNTLLTVTRLHRHGGTVRHNVFSYSIPLCDATA